MTDLTKDALLDLIDQHLTSIYCCTRVWEAWSVGTMSKDDFVEARDTDFASDLADAILATQHPSQFPGETVADRLDAMADAQPSGSQASSDLYAAATIWRKHLKGSQHPSQGAGEPVAYLDIGAGGYLDLGSDLSDEQLSALPKGRHMLGIIGTYGADGYAPSPPPTDAARVEADRRDAELWRFIAARNFQYFVPTRHWRLTDDAGKTLHEGRAESFEGGARAALAAERNNGIRPAGGEHGE